MAKESNVTFRRIKGRLVPIRLNKSQKGQLQGLGIAAGGAALAAGGGKAYKALVTKSATMSFKGFTNLDKALKNFGPAQMSFFETAKQKSLREASIKAMKSAESSLRMGKKLASFSGAVRIGASVLGAGLIDYGVSKFVNSMPRDKRKKVNKEWLSAAAISSGAIAPYAWDYAKKSFSAGMANRQTTMNFASQSWAKHGPKIKNAVMNALKAKF